MQELDFMQKLEGTLLVGEQHSAAGAASMDPELVYVTAAAATTSAAAVDELAASPPAAATPIAPAAALRANADGSSPQAQEVQQPTRELLGAQAQPVSHAQQTDEHQQQQPLGTLHNDYQQDLQQQQQQQQKGPAVSEGRGARSFGTVDLQVDGSSAACDGHVMQGKRRQADAAELEVACKRQKPKPAASNQRQQASPQEPSPAEEHRQQQQQQEKAGPSASCSLSFQQRSDPPPWLSQLHLPKHLDESQQDELQEAAMALMFLRAAGSHVDAPPGEVKQQLLQTLPLSCVQLPPLLRLRDGDLEEDAEPVEMFIRRRGGRVLAVCDMEGRSSCNGGRVRLVRGYLQHLLQQQYLAEERGKAVEELVERMRKKGGEGVVVELEEWLGQVQGPLRICLEVRKSIGRLCIGCR